MKKVAILTRRAGYNMGSSLQAYAMSKFIANIGYKTTILNYDEYSRFLLWRIKPVITKVTFSFLNIVPSISKKIFKNRFTNLLRAQIQKEQFYDFEANYLPLSKEVYYKSSDFNKTLTDYDIYVCGSDQIWVPAMFDPVFLLDFATKSCFDSVCTIAYSPSVGVTESCQIPQQEQELIKKIDFISCREREGAQALSQVINKDVPVTLDPTLMLSKDDWTEIMSDRHPNDGKDYILTYFLHTPDYANNIPNKFISDLSSKTNLPVVNIQMFNMSEVVDADKHIYDANPSDFLSFISKAKYICTNSFHCCVFSLQFQKPFYVFERYRKNSNENSSHNQNPRIYTLLKVFDRESALIKDEAAEISINEIIDTEVGSTNLSSLKDSSLQYIINAMK